MRQSLFTVEAKAHNATNLGLPLLCATAFILATDASEFAVGSVLSQKINGVERVISYWSQLNKAEHNYSTVEREALAVIAAC